VVHIVTPNEREISTLCDSFPALSGNVQSLGQQRPKVANVRHLLESAHRANDRGRLRRTEDRLDQASRFIVDRIGAQRILLRPRRETREVTDRTAIPEGHVHSAATWCVRIHERLVRDEFHTFLHRNHLTVLHALL